MKHLIEVCAGSVDDCIIAEQCGAHRIELNSAVHLGGLTPTVGTLVEAKKHTQIPIITMIRIRPGGFHYNTLEIETMFKDAEMMLAHGADGLVFGFLNADCTVDADTTRRFVALCHESQKEAIFHRAFDCVENAEAALEILIACGVDRILTSGLMPNAADGIENLARFNHHYGQKIQFCMGAGVNASNVKMLIEMTGISQCHGSFKGWYHDPTTQGGAVSYRYSDAGDYEGVDPEKLSAALNQLK